MEASKEVNGTAGDGSISAGSVFVKKVVTFLNDGAHGNRRVKNIQVRSTLFWSPLTELGCWNEGRY